MMNLALWIVAIAVAVAFAGSGLMKLLVPKDKLGNSSQGCAQDFSATSPRLIGFIEVLGAAGLILPALTHIAPVLVPLAATGLVLVVVDAGVVHSRPNEIPNIAVDVVLLVLAIFVAWGRFGPYPLGFRRQTTVRPTRCTPPINVVKPATRYSQLNLWQSARGCKRVGLAVSVGVHPRPTNAKQTGGSLDQARDSAEPLAT
jgi:uncharacterized membrane protein YphA (DoxX/SURF4 family)